MKIIQVIDGLRVGGAEQLLVTFTEATQHRNIDLTIVTFRVKSDHMRDTLEQLGAKLVFLPDRTLLDPLRLWQLYRLFKREKPDIIHAHLATATVVSSLVGKWLSIPVVSTIHNTQWSAKRQIRLRLHRLALRRWVTHIIAVGHSVVENFRSLVGTKEIKVIWNAVPPMPIFSDEQKASLRQSLVGDNQGPILICIGRLSEAKGHKDLLLAFRQINEQFPETRLLIVGDGNLRSDVEALVQQSGLQHAIMMLGIRQDVPALLAISDLLVSASHWEGLPVSILEAMASGVPIVATDVGDIPYVVVEGTGLVVPAHQPTVLADAVCQLLQDPERMKAYGEQAKNHIDQHYTTEVWVDTLLTYYRDIIESDT